MSGINVQARGLGILLFTCPLPLLASGIDDVYVGAKTGWVHGQNACESQADSCNNDSWAGGVFAGYNVNEWLDIETGYNYFGTIKADYPALADSSVNAPYSGKIQGIEFGAKPHWDVTDNVSLFAKAGTLAWWTKVTGDEIGYQHSAKDNGWSPMLGLGVETALTSNLSARLEYQWFDKVGGGDTGGSDINLVSLGLVYQFGSQEDVAPVAAPVVLATAATTAAPVNVLVDGISESILFDNAQTSLNSASRNTLSSVLHYLQQYPEAQLTIEAHTDSVGSMASNQTLSVLRARTVRDYFLSQGIAPSRLSAQGVGETQPVADNDTSAGRATNRRAELSSPSFMNAQ